jgi:hypothetical protein
MLWTISILSLRAHIYLVILCTLSLDNGEKQPEILLIYLSAPIIEAKGNQRLCSL